MAGRRGSVGTARMNKAIFWLGFVLAVVVVLLGAGTPTLYTPWSAFRGTNGIIIRTNAAGALVQVDGSALVGTNAFLTSLLWTNNAGTIQQTTNAPVQVTNTFTVMSLTSLGNSLGGITIAATNTNNVVYFGTNRFIHNFKPATNTGNNTFVGEEAGNFTMGGGGVIPPGFDGTQAGSYNTGIGKWALLRNTEGFFNTALGFEALTFNTLGRYNTALGLDALRTNTTGNYNTAGGVDAEYLNQTGSNNVAFGFFSLYQNTNGSFNVAIGGQAGENIQGDDNVAIGAFAMQQATNGGSKNVAVGYNSQRDIRQGDFNTSMGMNSLVLCTNSSQNTCLGVEAGRGTGAYASFGNVLVGYEAGYSSAGVLANAINTCVGMQAGFGLTTGAGNTILGGNISAACRNQVTSGSFNIALGYEATIPSPTANGQMSIGNLIYATGIDGTGATVSSGAVGIGTNAPAAKLHIIGQGIVNDLLRLGTKASDSKFRVDTNGNTFAAGTSFPTGSVWLANSTVGQVATLRSDGTLAPSNAVAAVTGAWKIGTTTASGTATITVTNSQTLIASNATTAQVDFTTTPDYVSTDVMRANLSLQLTNLVAGREVAVWLTGDTNANDRTVSVVTNGITAGCKIRWNFNSLTNGTSDFTVTNNMRAELQIKCLSASEVWAIWGPVR
jgi:hypothetical protein